MRTKAGEEEKEQQKTKDREDKERKGTGEKPDRENDMDLCSDNQSWLVLSDGRYLCQHRAASTKRLLASLRLPDKLLQMVLSLSKTHRSCTHLSQGHQVSAKNTCMN